ncbi:MAG: dethiobiotin synthase [Chitinispirillaceae bacterium]
MKGLFITGTGTDVGKTYVAGLLARTFISLGETVAYLKPVQTGCDKSGNGELVAPDVLHVQSQTGDACRFFVPYQFEPACSPHLAAKMAGKEISLHTIIDQYRQIKNCTIALVEGAGGILVPLNDKVFMTDLIQALKIPAVVVVTPGLGTLNHTFLSLEALRNRGLDSAGVVINNIHDIERDFIFEDNVHMIRESVHPLPCLEVNYGNDSDQRIKDFCYALKSQL